MSTEKLPSVEIKNFSKTYGKPSVSKTKACDDISLTFSAGSVTGLLGLNGAGKTTLLKAICGMHYADEGTITLKLKDSSSVSNLEELRKATGFLPETPFLEENISVLEILEQETLLYGTENKAQKIKEAVKICSLDEVLDKKIKSLSKGYRQRVSFAKVLVHNPEVLILDEFSSGLDPTQIKQMREIIAAISKEKAVILSTHHLEEVTNLCKEIYILHKGKILISGTEKYILEKTNTKTLEDAFILLTEERKK